MTKLMIGLMMAGALLVGCDKGGEAGMKTEGSAKGAEKGAAASGESTGAKECDDYLKEIEECAKKNPAIGKPMLDTIAQTREAFKAGLSVGASKDATVQSCKQSADALKASCK
jgi:hypothetical protein